MDIKKLKLYFTKKRIIWGVVALAVLFVGYNVFFNKKPNQETLVAHAGDFLQQVSVSGKVVATENLDLSFEQTGIVRSVYVKAGDAVAVGKLLASQDTAQLASQYAEMKAGIDLQKAKLNQLLAGASNEDIKIKQDGVDSAKQDLANAYTSALATLNSAYNAVSNAYTVAAYMKRTYFSSIDQESILVQYALNDISTSLTDAKKVLNSAKASQDSVNSAITSLDLDLSNVYSAVKTIREQCDKDVYYTQVSSTDKTSLDTQKTNVTTAQTNMASAKQNINSYQAALQQAQNQLNSILAPSRPTDIAVFEAQIAQAEASAQGVAVQIRNRQIFAPISGVVTDVPAKVGSTFGSSQIAVSLISAGQFEVEGYVPEIYISFVKVGDDADITTDSFGSDKIFKAKVISIDPSETLKDGVSTYKVKLGFNEANSEIRDGMTANVMIITLKKMNVISVPQKIVKSHDGKKFVKVKQGEVISEKEVIIGEVSSAGQAEVLSGLSEGDIIVVE